MNKSDIGALGMFLVAVVTFFAGMLAAIILGATW